MKITKYIFIYTLLLCMTAQGMTLSQICMGPDHCDSEIDWASSCHTPGNDTHNSHESSFGYEGNNCIDISISSTGNLNRSINNNQLNSAKPIILKPAATDHPFSPSDFSKLKTNFFPVFTDMTTRSLASTILIV